MFTFEEMRHLHAISSIRIGRPCQWIIESRALRAGTFLRLNGLYFTYSPLVQHNYLRFIKKLHTTSHAAPVRVSRFHLFRIVRTPAQRPGS